MAITVAIQGYEGSFHQKAARAYWGAEVGIVPCATFREVVRRAAEEGSAPGGGVMAIENSIAGSILPNYTLLEGSGLRVVGEVFLHIRQHLLVNPGVRLEEIHEVHSHPMAILQCLDFLEKHRWRVVETEDTALSAKHLHLHHTRHAAAIASELAAELFGLDILVPDIHTLPNNLTRFLILQRPDAVRDRTGDNKASVNFQTQHTRGSLARVLTGIAEHGINLSKLQSVPVAGSDWKYSFHADMEFDSRPQFDAAICALAPLTEHLHVYGVYRRGETVR